MEVFYVLLGVVAVIGVYLALTYNGLIQERNKVKNSWSQIDVQLKRRFDLIPNLVETVKGFAKQEKDIFMAFADARKMFDQGVKDNSVKELAQAEQMLSKGLGRLIAVAEAYPQLKSDTSFNNLMGTLKETEDKISYSRQFYNDSVLKFNNKVEVFPTNLIANMFNFKVFEFFKVDAEEERKNVKVSF